MADRTDPSPVAVLGTGIMGAAFAASLLASGVAVRAWNRTRSRAEPLAALGAVIAESPAEAVAGCAVVVVSLFDDLASRQVLVEQGTLDHIDPGSVVVETSTLSVGWVDELATLARARGVALVDAPVCGSRGEAERREVVFVAGGEAAAVDAARPALQVLGSRVLPVGGPGAGMRLKLANNLLTTTQLVSLAQAVALCRRSGVDPHHLADLVAGASSGSPLVRGKVRRLLDRGDAAESTAATSAKDITYLRRAALDVGLPVDLLDLLAHRFEAAASADGDHGTTDVIESLSRTFEAPPIVGRAAPISDLGHLANDPEAHADRTVEVWGRIVRRHRLPSLTFVGLRAQGIDLQVGIDPDLGGEVRRGELWRFSGQMGRSRTGTSTLFATSGTRLAAGRGTERTVGPDLLRRARLHRRAVDALQARGYVHVPLPLVVSHPDGGLSTSSSVTSGSTHHGWIRSNHEAPLQALLGDGAPRVCHVGPVVRNGREYPLLEAHAAFLDFESGLTEAKAIVAELCGAMAPRTADLRWVAEDQWEWSDALATISARLGRSEQAVDADPRAATTLASASGLDPSAHPETIFRRFLDLETSRIGRPVVFCRTPSWSSPLYRLARAGGLQQAIGLAPDVGVLFDAGLQQHDAGDLEVAIEAQRARSSDTTTARMVHTPLTQVVRQGVPPSFGFGSAIERLAHNSSGR